MSRDVPRRSPWTAAAARPGPLLALAAVVGATAHPWGAAPNAPASAAAPAVHGARRPTR